MKQRAGLWRQELENFLDGRRTRYRLVEQRALVGIVLFVYVKEKFVAEGAVKDVQVRHYPGLYAIAVPSWCGSLPDDNTRTKIGPGQPRFPQGTL